MQSLLLAQGATDDPTHVEGNKLYRNNLFSDPNKPELVVFLQESDYQFVNDILMERLDRSNHRSGISQKNDSSNDQEAETVEKIDDCNPRKQSGSGMLYVDSSLFAASSPEGSAKNGSHQQDISRLGNPSLTEKFIHQLAQEESGSLAVGYHFPQIPCSGNVSLRSTTSTGSSQSFAFPVMPPEWPGSPVRMAEPDRRQWRKQGNWKICCLCCKF